MNKFSRFSIIILGVIIAVTAVLLFLMLTNISNVPNDPTMGAWISTNLSWAYILFFLALGLSLIFLVYQLITDFKAAKGGLMAVGFLLLILLVSYLLASGEMPKFPGVQKFIDSGTLTPQVSKWVDTGLISVYFLLGIAVISLIYASFSRVFRR